MSCALQAPCQIMPTFSDVCDPSVDWKNLDAITSCQKAVKLKFAQIMAREGAQRLAEVSKAFEQAALHHPNYAPVAEALQAIGTGELETLKKLRIRLEQDNTLFGQIRSAEKRFGSLRDSYPLLHGAISGDISNSVWKERILMFPDACRWKFAHTRIAEYLSTQKTDTLKKQFNACEERIGRIVSELASLLALEVLL